MKIAVSYLSSNNYLECINKINESNADYVHVDLCDGKYVNTKNFEIKDTIKLLKNSKKPLNIHLMVENPKKIIKHFKNLNVESITIHNLSNSEKIFCLTRFQDRCPNSGLIKHKDFCRYLTQRELEAAQTVPSGYTDCLTYSQAQCVLGDGWTVDVIVHILKSSFNTEVEEVMLGKNKVGQLKWII